MKRREILSLLAPAFVLYAFACGSSDSADGPKTNDAGSTQDATPTVDSASPADAGTDAAPGPTKLYAFVGSSGDGKIRTYSVDETTGAWTPISDVAAGTNPWWVAFDGPRKHVVSVDEGSKTLQSFTFDNGTLTPVNSKPSNGTGAPVHLSIDATGQWVMGANYGTGGGTGNLTVRPIDADGTLGDPTALADHLDGAQWVGMDWFGTYIWVAATERNVVMQYRFDHDAGLIEINGWGDPPANSGPRHLALHPNQKWAYVMNRYGFNNAGFPDVTFYALDPNFAGKLLDIDTVKAMPDGVDPFDTHAENNGGAEIVVHPNGKWVFGSTRGYNSLVSFSIDQTTGKLTRMNNVDVEPKPRSFAIDPDGKWLYVANQDSNKITGYTIDGNGVLQSATKTVDVPSPAFVGLARF